MSKALSAIFGAIGDILGGRLTLLALLNLVLAGAISGAGSVTHANGTQIMTGCGNSYTGGTTLTGALGGSLLSTDCIRNGGESSGAAEGRLEKRARACRWRKSAAPQAGQA